MKLNKIQTLFWDFDGVIMDSNAVRDRGFEEVLKDYPQTEVDALMAFIEKMVAYLDMLNSDIFLKIFAVKVSLKKRLTYGLISFLKL